MCGIAGMIDYKENLTEKRRVFEAMLKTLTRRGPDQDGMYITPDAALVHARLAVIDIENGLQPMKLTQGDEEYVLVYNGELYNTEEIRASLSNLGHKFIGHSDTEVLLHAYAEWKSDCLERFNGIFAFAVWENHNKRLFVARDRIGVKPFFYAIRDGAFIFGSELKSLLANPLVKPEIDSEGVAEILLIGPGRTPGCGVFRNVYELLPGECGYFDDTGLKKRRYWQLEDRHHCETFAETVEHVRWLVIDSIERQLVSDVPIATFLSGGLDSSIISSVAKRYLDREGKKLDTFSVDYFDNEKYFKVNKFQPSNDKDFIEIMNDYLGAENHRVILDNLNLADALCEAVDARDLPGMTDVDSSLLLFCREMKKDTTVALSGESADEIFGGYPWYRDKEIRERFGFPWSQSTDFRASFLGDEYKNIDAHEFVNSRYKATVKDTSVLSGTSPLERRMKEMINLNFTWFMQTLLDRKDRMSMYSGLEVRVPFCDYRIAEYMYSVPWEMKDYEGREKGLLRVAMQDYLPEEVLWRKKSPYPKTHNPVYLAIMQSRLREILHDNNSPLFAIVDKKALQSLLDDTRSTPWYGQLMTTPQTIAYFLQMNYWLGKYGVMV
jgi:asparagine synthase (glutamine-hydrolysing)